MTLVLDTRQDNYGTLYATSGPRSSKVLESRRRRFSWTTPVFSGETSVSYENYEEVSLKLKEKQNAANAAAQNPMPVPKFDDKDKPESKSGGRFNIVRQNSLVKALKFFRGLSKNSQPKKNQRNSAIIDDKPAALLAQNIEDGTGSSVEDFVIDSKGRESVTMSKDLVEKAIQNQNETGTELLKKRNNSPPASPTLAGSPSDSSSAKVRDNRGAKSLGKSSSSQSKKKSSRKNSTDGQNRYMVNESGKIVPVNGTPQAPRGILKETDFPINGKPISEEQKTKRQLSKNKRSITNISRHRRSIISIKAKPEKKFRFNEFVVIFETYAMDEYDRRMGVRLEDNLCNTTNIKLELNEYKSKEMVVHAESRKYTHFLNI